MTEITQAPRIAAAPPRAAILAPTPAAVLTNAAAGVSSRPHETFHDRLRRLHRESGLSFPQIARAVGASTPQSVQNWVRRTNPPYPRLHMIVPLARALGVTADYLLSGEESPVAAK